MGLWFNANDRLVVRWRGLDIHFQAMPHPTVPGLAHTMERIHSTVFHLQEISHVGAEYALKVRSPKGRGPHLEQVCQLVGRLRSLPGLECCDRLCVTRDRFPETVALYPDLEYSIVMPWLRGTTWSDAHAEQGDAYTRAAGVASQKTGNLSRWRCLQLAMRLAEVLATLERQHLSHCNLGPQKIMLELNPVVPEVELIGLEGVYSSHLEPPENFLDSNPEYRHPKDRRPSPESDRFPGALLISEILAWYDEEIRSLFRDQSDSLFTADELLHTSNPKFRALVRSLENHHADLAELLKKAWTSDLPGDAPTLLTWIETLGRISRTTSEYAWMRGPATALETRGTTLGDHDPGLGSTPAGTPET